MSNKNITFEAEMIAYLHLAPDGTYTTGREFTNIYKKPLEGQAWAFKEEGPMSHFLHRANINSNLSSQMKSDFLRQYSIINPYHTINWRP
jgi:hypothetical protein